jgi:PAS domain S-box-containing protein
VNARRARPSKFPFPVVAIGASAGGLEACQKLLDALPGKTGMAVLIVQHLDPDHESALADLLSGHTKMKVSQAADAEKIEPDHVYIISPGHQLSVINGHLRLEAFTSKTRPRLPFDYLLVSMAKDLGSRAVAVVLSGTGSDGSLGIRNIRAKGGTVIAQEPSEAAYDGMPRSAIDSGQVTHVASLDRVADLLMQVTDPSYAVRSAVPGEVKGATFDQIITLLLSSTAYDFRSYKTGTLLRRIKRRLESCEKAEGDAGKYIKILQNDPEELDRLVQDLLINVTEFFRDPAVFQFLETDILPKLIRDKAAGLPLRLWVVGCSTGQEAYSMAILVHEALARAGSDRLVQIFASDIDPEAVAEARDGVYRDTKGLSAQRLEQYFKREDGVWRVTPDLRGMVTFTVQDVLSDPPFSRLDLVSCRNLLIYLKPDAQSRLIGLFHFALLPDGILLLGAAETVGRPDERFAIISEASKLYRNQGSSRVLDVLGSLASPHGLVTHAGSGLGLRQRPFDPGDVLRNKVLERYDTATALVNEAHECLYLMGPADDYFRVSPGRPVSGLLAMARDGVARELREALEEAGRTNATAVVTGGQLRRTGKAAGFTVAVDPFTHDGQKLFMVSVSPANLPAASQTSVGPFDSHAIMLERELDETRAELGKALRELQQGSSLQYASLAEAKSIQEEYQASNEELLSSKEELQSLNEELTSLNAELHGALTREKASANDMQNILYSTDTATLFLDPKLQVRFFTPGITALFNLRAVDIGRPLEDLTLLASDATLFADIRTALNGKTRISADVQTYSGQWFNRSALPYRTRDGQVEGVVITLDDITDRKQHEAALEAQTTAASVARARLENAIESLPDAFAYFDADDVLVLCNAQYRALHTALNIPIMPGLRFDQLVPKEPDAALPDQAADGYAVWIAQRATERRTAGGRQDVRLADGRWFSLIEQPTPDGGWVNMLIDVSTVKTSEQQLVERASAIAAVHEGIAITDAARNLTYMNDASRKMSGVTEDAVVLGRHWSLLYAPETKAQLSVAEVALKRTGHWRGSLSGHRPDGHSFDQDVSATLMPNGNVVIITRDVSKSNEDRRERDKLREQLVIAQRREIINVVAAGLAHDLNNLLAVISGSAELILESESQATDKDVEAMRSENATRLGHILRATEQSSALLKRLVSLGGRKQERAKIDLRHPLQEAADLIGAGLAPNIALHVRLPRTALEVDADPIDILQIILNLGLNARDALGAGPQSIDITLSRAGTAQMAGPFAIGDVVEGHPYVSLTVSDTGRGMDDALLSRVFTPYFSTKGAAGTGLGLPVVKEIVVSYGGAIKVESTIGTGSRFTILLPKDPLGGAGLRAKLQKRRPRAPSRPGSLRGKVALVVDDDEAFRKLITLFLKQTGIDVISCGDPLDALEALAAASGGCDVLITDFDMPHLNGVQLAETVASIAPGLPMILVTAAVQPEGSRGQQDQQRLFDAVLSKPVEKAMIIDAVSLALGQAKPAPG